nr:hypothetical protein [Tanacetum cinerariifolium]
EQHSPHLDPSSPSHPTTTTEPIPQTPTETPTETPTLRRYTRRAIRISQSKALSSAADEPLLFPSVGSTTLDNKCKVSGSGNSATQQWEVFCTNSVSRIKCSFGEDAPIKGGIKETWEEVAADKSIELWSNDTDEMVNILSSMEATNILTSGVAVVSVSHVAGVSTKGVPTVSGLFPTASAIFTTASVVTPYTRRSRGISAKDKGKEKVVESEVPKKRKLQEQIDAQVAREVEKEFARKNQRVNEQLARDSKIARLHAEKELKMMIEGLDRSNEAQQSKLLSKKDQREFYMSVLKSHAGWKTRHFRGMTLEEIKEKFIPVWKQLEDFMPMSSKEAGERLVPLEEVYVEALQVKHPIIDWKTHSKENREYWKIIRLAAGHDRENINKTSALPYESSPRVMV